MGTSIIVNGYYVINFMIVASALDEIFGMTITSMILNLSIFLSFINVMSQLLDKKMCTEPQKMSV